MTCILEIVLEHYLIGTHMLPESNTVNGCTMRFHGFESLASQQSASMSLHTRLPTRLVISKSNVCLGSECRSQTCAKLVLALRVKGETFLFVRAFPRSP